MTSTEPDPTACRYCGRMLPTSHAASIHERHYCDKRPTQPDAPAEEPWELAP